MFRNWGFLLGEMIVLIVIAALLGLLVGWIIWGRRRQESYTYSTSAVELREVEKDLNACKARHGEKDAEIAALKAQLADASQAAKVKPVTAPAPTPVAASESTDYDGDGIEEGVNEGSQPARLTEARGGKPDDLKMIKGVGPKLEKLLHSMGFFHFDQVADWTSDEVAWVDANLEGFKGRVSRDGWVAQAKILASGGETEFSDRVKDGDVY